MVDAALRPFYPGGRHPVLVIQETGLGLSAASGRIRKISPPPGSDPQTFQPVACRYTDNDVKIVVYYKALKV